MKVSYLWMAYFRLDWRAVEKNGVLVLDLRPCVHPFINNTMMFLAGFTAFPRDLTGLVSRSFLQMLGMEATFKEFRRDVRCPVSACGISMRVRLFLGDPPKHG